MQDLPYLPVIPTNPLKTAQDYYDACYRAPNTRHLGHLFSHSITLQSTTEGKIKKIKGIKKIQDYHIQTIFNPREGFRLKKVTVEEKSPTTADLTLVFQSNATPSLPTEEYFQHTELVLTPRPNATRPKKMKIKSIAITTEQKETQLATSSTSVAPK